jgi:hypothetical protein
MCDEEIGLCGGRTWDLIVTSTDFDKIYQVSTSDIDDVAECAVLYFLFGLCVVERTCTNVV